jgi:hypothetical protein
MSTKILQTVGKPIAIGLAGLAIAKYFYGENLSDEIILFNQNFPAWLGIGGSLVATTMATETLSNYILPLLPAGFRTTDSQKLLVEPAINAAVITALFSFAATPGSPDSSKMFKIVLGASSTILEDYAYRTVAPLIV